MNKYYFIIVFKSDDSDEVEETLTFEEETDVWNRLSFLIRAKKPFKVFKGILLMNNA